MTDRVYNVLFLCTGNSARSILAEAILRKDGAGRFTVCDDAAGEVCPVWPGQPLTAHWGIEDPSSVEGSEIEKEHAFGTAARFMKNRITAFLNLPLTSIDRMAVDHHLQRIGRMEGTTSKNTDGA
ncbi:arsenate reductase ArsC [Mesorhizobium sp. ANAO-SY3R2]|uniref:arsenate reductase/protein-tyrosine-phosphatase family protein n=1 Tax=Mesorhizobium sp. ANAO-SY3R2 TaxID=3166644 RepID=UPI00366FF38C